MSIINDNVEQNGGRQHHHSSSGLNINPFERWHFEISLELTFVSKWVTRTKKKQSRNLVYIFKSASTFWNVTQRSLADSIFKVKELIQESNNFPKTNAR